MKNKPNKNDRPLTSAADLRGEVSYQDFEFKPHFVRLGALRPEAAKERLVLTPAAKAKIDRRGMVYVLCINRKILKIGCTITDFAARVQSCNCGKKAFRASGTSAAQSAARGWWRAWRPHRRRRRNTRLAPMVYNCRHRFRPRVLMRQARRR
ncbi:MAG: hypothetical protein OXU29_10570 [Gammaproteobacteria bacterium]|nr:hypothetical protein [Gammaproteobacteria bacterium]